MERHIIKIAPSGSTSIEVQGLKGPKCHEATVNIELRGTVTNDIATGEAYENESVSDSDLT